MHCFAFVQSSNLGVLFLKVRNWFKYKHEKLHPENPVSPTALDLVVDLSGSHMLSDEPKSSQKPKV